MQSPTMKREMLLQKKSSLKDSHSELNRSSTSNAKFSRQQSRREVFKNQLMAKRSIQKNASIVSGMQNLIHSRTDRANLQHNAQSQSLIHIPDQKVTDFAFVAHYEKSTKFNDPYQGSQHKLVIPQNAHNFKFHFETEDQNPEFHGEQKIETQRKVSPFKLSSILKSRCDSSSGSLGDGSDRQQILLLEIKQLKRENTFLKKKIHDLNRQLHGGILPQQLGRLRTDSNKKPETFKPRAQKGHPQQNLESMHLSVNIFFEEIKNLLNSMSQLFKIDFSEEEIRKFESFHSPEQMHREITQELCPVNKQWIFRKYFLKKKIERIGLAEETEKLPLLLDTFREYYQHKQESELSITETIDDMIMYTSDLNKWLLTKASQKLKKDQQVDETDLKLRNREQASKCDLKKSAEVDTLRLPVPDSKSSLNYVKKNKGANLSPKVTKRAF